MERKILLLITLVAFALMASLLVSRTLSMATRWANDEESLSLEQKVDVTPLGTSTHIVYLDSTWYGFALEIDNDALNPYLYNFQCSIDGSFYPVCVGQDLDPIFNKRYYRGFVQFDTSSIPDGADIISVELNFQCPSTINNFIGDYVDSYSCDFEIHPLVHKPSSYGRGNPNDNRGNDLFHDADDGSYYGWITYVYQNGQWYSKTLGSIATIDLEGSLSADWFGLGFKEFTENNDGTGIDRGISLWGCGYIYLKVTYQVEGYFYNGWVDYLTDSDGDGYWGRINICCDPDTSVADLSVYTKIWGRDPDGAEHYLGQTSATTIHYSDVDTICKLITDSSTGITGEWDFELELYDDYNDQLLDTLSYGEDPQLTDILMDRTDSVCAPDLVASVNSYDPDPPSAHQSVRIWFGIQNNGEGTAFGSFRNKIYIDNTYIAYCDGSDMTTTGSLLCFHDWADPSAGYHKVCVVADADGAICESNEGNNEDCDYNKWFKSPDLVVEDIWTDPSSPCSDTSFTAYVRIKNNGDLGASTTFRTTLYIDGSPVGSFDKAGLGAGISYWHALPISGLSGGSHNFCAVVDVNNNVDEANKATGNGKGTGETNNDDYCETITVDSFDFSISALPTSLTIEQGDSATYTVLVTNLGCPQSVSLSFSGCPPGATCSFSPLSGTPTFTSTLTVQTTCDTPPDTYTLAITGSGGGLTRSTTVQLEVTSGFDFSVSGLPSSITVECGTSTTYAIAIDNLGCPETVSLGVSGLPSGATASFSPPSGTPTFSSTLTVQTVDPTAPGNYTLTITGSGGGLTRTTTVELVVTCPEFDFSVSGLPSSGKVECGASTDYLVTVLLVTGTPETVSLGVSGLPSGATASFSPPSGTPTFSSTLTVQTVDPTAPGNYTLTITGSGGGLTRTTTVELVVTCPDGPEWNVKLNATISSYNDISDFGVRINATYGFDPAYDLLEPPEPPVGVVSYFWYPDNPTFPVDTRKLATSKIPPTDCMVWPYKVKAKGIDGVMTISWSTSDIANIPPEYDVHLDGVNMREVTKYSFSVEMDVEYTFTIRVCVGCDFEYQFIAGWNMASFPCVPENATWDDLLGGCGYYQVYTWDGSGYVPPLTSGPVCGVGYWVLVLEPCTVKVAGGVCCESYERDLPAGWSMIGSICDCVVDADCVFPGYCQLMTWDGSGYVLSTVIEPGKGYWVLVLEPTHIIVDCSCAVP